VCYLVGDKVRELGVVSVEGNIACVEDNLQAREDRDD
jgi:hypothetical protein